ncbi:MAG: sortase [Promicromonosporaceae bacterium]|nr:sortase [Promicromonosporaceae bacterium]
MPRPRRRDPVRIVASVVLLAGLALAATWAWDYYGTSWQANRTAAAALRDFTLANPLPTNLVSALRTDLENAPTRPRATDGAVIGTLWVPSWAGKAGTRGDVNDGRTPVKEGVTVRVLDSGAAGRFAEGQQPGEVGNVSLAGHRRTYGDNFLHVDALVPGDVVVIETPDAWFVYEVEVPGYLVAPQDGADVIGRAPHGLPDGGRYLTLVSCHSVVDGAWGNDHRIIVHARAVGWLPHGDGLPPQLAGLAVPG